MTETVRTFAASVLEGRSLEEKLRPPPPDLVDEERGAGRAPSAPARAPSIAIERDPRRRRKVPPIEGMPDPAQRVRIVHGLMNHELQAVELFAWALLRYPDAPPGFRRGLVEILREEQSHFRLYESRLRALGGGFGDWPLSGYFWSKAPAMDCPLRFCAAMGLTFENANLDHARDLERAARAAGDEALAAVLSRVHDDEVGHVRFGYVWLRRLGGRGRPPLSIYLDAVPFPLRPVLARGPVFHEDSRRRAGLDDAFIAALREAVRPQALYRFCKFGGTRRGSTGTSR